LISVDSGRFFFHRFPLTLRVILIIFTALSELLLTHRELSPRAHWALSSAKPGSGVAQLRDNDLGTFWQSDGPQPHRITLGLARGARVAMVLLHCDHRLDERSVAVFMWFFGVFGCYLLENGWSFGGNCVIWAGI
jgi:hypothetical protein